MDDSDRLDTSRWLTSVSTEMARRSFDGLRDPADDESGLRRVDAAGDAMLSCLSRVSQNRIWLYESKLGLHDEPDEMSRRVDEMSR